MRSVSVLMAALSCCANVSFAQTADEDVGKANFRIFCAPCHGIQAQGGRGPDLRQSRADLFGTISKGVDGTEMRGYSSQFEDTMINSIVAYLRSTAHLPAQKSTGDALHGKAVFEGKGGCTGCHASGGIGPALDRVGRQRSLDYLREKIVTPSVNITPGFRTLTVKLKNGSSIRGIQRNLDDFSAQLVDVNRHYYSFLTTDVAFIEQDAVSLMPARKLVESELNDLVSYLSTLRGAAGTAGTAASGPDVHK